MTDNRGDSNLCNLIIGMSQSGKTYFTINELILPSPKKVVVVNDEPHSSYKAWPVVDIEKLQYLESGVVNVIIGNDRTVDEDFALLNKYCYNTLIICEDARKYIPQDLPVSVVKLIGNLKGHNNDIVFQYWTYTEVAPRLFMKAHAMEIFITQDSPDDSKKKMSGTYYNVKPVFERVRARYNEAKTKGLQRTDARMHPHESVIIDIPLL